jgi:hypothetical protein
MLKLAAAVFAGELESVTLTVKLKVPDAVGVPEIVPLVESVRAPGNDPELTLQLYGVVPPVAASVAEYAVPTCPPARELVVICTGTTDVVTVMLNDFVAVWAGDEESFAWTVNVNVPAPVGVPEIVPLVESVRPPGNEPELTLQLYGVVPPVAASVAEYAVPTCPPARELVVICTGTADVVTVMLNDFVAVWAGDEESFAWTVNGNVPAPVGVPEIVPLVESVRPPGNEPELTLQLYGVVPPVAFKTAL